MQASRRPSHPFRVPSLGLRDYFDSFLGKMHLPLWPAQLHCAAMGCTSAVSHALATAPISVHVDAITMRRWGTRILSRVLGGHVSRIQAAAAERIAGMCNIREAAKNGDVKLVRDHLLADPCSLHTSDASQGNIPHFFNRNLRGMTALHWSSVQGHNEVCKVLVESQADVNAKDNPMHQRTPLHYSSGNGHTDTCNLLVECHADVNARTSNGDTPLHLSAQHGHLEICKLLVEYQADVNAKQNGRGPWGTAGSRDAPCGKTALHFSSENGFLEICKLLIECQADVNANDTNGRTALHFSSGNGIYCKPNLEICKLLIESQADVNAKDKCGHTPLFVWGSPGHDDHLLSEVCKLLISFQADVNAKDNIQSTVLHHCSSAGYLEVCKLLVESRADVIDKDIRGETALHCSRTYDVCKFLVESQADLNAKDNDQRTPLHSASFGRVEACSALVECKADVNAKDESGYTAMSLARFDHEDNTNDPYHSVIRYLESVGGKYSDENE